ncbi:hypothetical protein HYE60_06415 [Aggregatibacter actinomycetemcomitans]|uniref:hypothetical protein n=1 Tax=Aggregatibacter actinomycetemcomitans TaxID=714 RepID=UPI00197C3FF8|nr:hypothetical protein [Aggregatibacter actinomycetemcomitans]MBN6074879.1 hypothetical protein [Aggregatibacter actinomycetemcomitans]
MNEWIERGICPEFDGEYLVYIPYDGGHILIETYDADLGGWLEYDEEITHWMELPRSPEFDVGE